MLDLDRLRSIVLHASPLGHKVMGSLLLGPSYNLPPRTHIQVQGRHHLPAAPAVLAMNHTDRYNYWPFQYWLWRKENRFTATWVKGKYYENRWVGRFMELTNNIPAPSKGYVMTRDFLNVMGRAPSGDEYLGLRELSSGKTLPDGSLPSEICEHARNMLGRFYNPEVQTYSECLASLLADMSEVFLQLNAQAFDKGLHLLIFPQGTRSIRLSAGHIGLVQAALRFKRAIVPIGCSGTDKVYPGGNPWARGGKITYRIGEVMEYGSFSEYHLPPETDPFAPDLAPEHREKMQALVDLVMGRISDLVDDEYKFGAAPAGGRVRGSKRFL